VVVPRVSPLLAPLATLSRALSGLPSRAQRFVTILPVRKNQTTSVFDIRIDYPIADGANLVVMGGGETIRVSGSDVNPRLLVFPPISVRALPTHVLIKITPITAVAGNTLDIDYVGVIQADDSACALLSAVPPGVAAGTLVLDPLTENVAARAVWTTATPTDLPLSAYSGDIRALNVRGSQVAVALFATGGTSPTRWRLYDSGGGAVVNAGLTVERQRAFLIPE